MENRSNLQNREINLKSLVVRVLLRWKSILLAVLVCCIFGSAYKYISLKKENSDAEPDSAEQQESYDEVEYYEELLKSFDQAIEDRKEYLNHSALRNFDLYNTGVSNELLYVRKTGSDENQVPADETESAESDPNIDMIIEAMKNFVNVGIDWTGHVGDQELGHAYFHELLTISTKGNGFTVQVYYMDEAGAEKIIDYVVEQIYKEFSNVQKAGGFENYELISLGQYTSSVVFEKNIGWLGKQLSEIDNLEDQRKDVQSDLNAAETARSAKPDSGQSGGLKTIVKTGIKAGVLGFAGMIGLILLRLIFGDKVLSGKEFNDYYKFRKIGSLAGNRKGSAEKLIMRMEKENRTELSEDNCYKLAAANIREYAPKIQKIGIIGDADPKLLTEVRDHLVNEDSEKEFVLLNDINNNPDDRKALMSVGGVIMIAETEKTKYANVDDLLRTVDLYQVPVIGTIVKN